MGLIMGLNITCWALVSKTADPAQSMYIGNLNKQIWALITYIGPGPEVLSLDRPTIYNHATRMGEDRLVWVMISYVRPGRVEIDQDGLG